MNYQLSHKNITQHWGAITLALLLLYIAFIYATTLLINPPDMTSTAVFIGTAKALPLILFMPFMLKKAYYKLYAWLCYLLILYFCWAVLNAFAPGQEGTVGIIECGIIVSLFTASMLSTRWSR